MRLSGLVRGVARWETEPDPADQQGPRFQAARARVFGRLPQGFTYRVETDLIGPKLLDGWIEWSPGRGLHVQVGHLRPIVSSEMLLQLEHTVFTQRALVVQRIAPRWDWGVDVGGQAGVFRWDAGVFEAGWLTRGAQPLFAGRIGLVFDRGSHQVEFDLAGAATEDAGSQWAGGPFFGRRVQGVLSGRWHHKSWTATGELHASLFDPEVARTDYPVGGQITLQAWPTQYGSVALRTEAYGRSLLASLDYALVAGARLTPIPDDAPPIQLMVDYRIPLHRRRLGDHAMSLGLQLWL